MKRTEIRKNMKIETAIREFPEIIEILFNHGLGCIGCRLAAQETLEQGAKAHGLSSKEIDSLIRELNLAVKKRK